jgi:hypothetical protein
MSMMEAMEFIGKNFLCAGRSLERKELHYSDYN